MTSTKTPCTCTHTQRGHTLASSWRGGSAWRCIAVGCTCTGDPRYGRVTEVDDAAR